MVRGAPKTESKEKTMKTLNLKAIASAFAALALTVVLSWTFVGDTGLARVQNATGTSLLASVSALVR
jgi:hypothetical protein